MQLKLDIITQEKHLLSDTVDQITAPAATGEVTILPNHIPLFTRLNDGIIRYRKGTTAIEYAVLGGFMDVAPGSHVTILADSAIRSADINLAKAEAAKAKAEAALQNKQSEVEFKLAEAALRKALLELKAARRHHGSNPLPSAA
ncbi:ATP synthase F1 subunit epsilon [Microgenomates group bacterium RBG_16_45_19]|nr:MAG: ATP synthase F1 subunit epsilon [Microgenomates group bacterium RBG_16_45_19]